MLDFAVASAVIDFFFQVFPLSYIIYISVLNANSIYNSFVMFFFLVVVYFPYPVKQLLMLSIIICRELLGILKQ